MTVLLETRDLVKQYSKRDSLFKKSGDIVAVDKINLTLEKGKSIGLIGESGCGKSTFGRMICGLEKVTDGKVFLQGEDVTDYTMSQFRPLRKNIQMIFQNSFSAFDPKNTLGKSLDEVLRNFEDLTKEERLKRCVEVFKQVGLDPKLLNRYPNEVSGGQCQRANIARAIILNPSIVVCDEPVASLDFAIRKNILNLLKDISKKHDITYIFITHDLSTIKYVCDQVAIMYLGNMVEILDVDLLEDMKHPYTIELFNSILIADPNRRRDRKKTIEVSEVVHTQALGCVYYERCKKHIDKCKNQKPKLKEISNGHKIACHMFL